MALLEPATEDEMAGFLELTRQETAAYLEATLKAMAATWEQYATWFRTVGRVYAVRDGGANAGFCWTEVRGRILHLHGLILKREFQGRGIGGGVLRDLEARYAGRVDAIELGVHSSNAAALRLYERAGYRTVERKEDVGFLILRKDLSARQNP